MKNARTTHNKRTKIRKHAQQIMGTKEKWKTKKRTKIINNARKPHGNTNKTNENHIQIFKNSWTNKKHEDTFK